MKCEFEATASDGRRLMVAVDAVGDAIVLPMHLREAASALLKRIGFPEVAHCLADEIARRNRDVWPMTPALSAFPANYAHTVDKVADCVAATIRLAARG